MLLKFVKEAAQNYDYLYIKKSTKNYNTIVYIETLFVFTKTKIMFSENFVLSFWDFNGKKETKTLELEINLKSSDCC